MQSNSEWVLRKRNGGRPNRNRIQPEGIGAGEGPVTEACRSLACSLAYAVRQAQDAFPQLIPRFKLPALL